MSKTKALLTVGIISLFLGLSVSPAMSTFTQQENIATYSIYDENGSLQNFELSEEDAQQVDGILAQITEKIQAASTYEEMINIMNTYLKDYGRYPVVILLLSLIIKWIQFTNNVNQIRPLRKNAFVISWGFTQKFNPFKENKAQLYRPFTMWYYSGRSNLVVNSRTTIVDFSPFSIKTMNGRQIGFMRNFAGIYVHRENTLGDNSYTMMFGRAMNIRGFDISPFHN
jgi:hypothetical protein